MNEEAAKDRRAQRKELRREAIIDVAQRSFLEHGFAASSMSTIAAACGGSKTTLWSHFSSKEALFEALIDRMVGNFSGALSEALLTDGGAEAALRRFGLVFLTKILSADALALKRMINSEAQRFPMLAQAFYERGPAPVRERLARYIAGEMEAGRLRDGDPELAARQFLSLCQGGCFSDTIWHRAGAPSSTPEQDVDTAVNAFFRIWGKTR